MNARILLPFLLACIFAHPAAAAGAPAGSTYDLASFRGELLRLAGLLEQKPSAKEMETLGASLPPSWKVSTPEKTYIISTAPLRAQLAAGSRENAADWIGHLDGVIEGALTRGADSTAARPELNRILAGPEFAAVRPPGPLELLRQRIIAWLDRMLAKLFGGIYRHPMGAEILFWVLLIGGVALIALLAFRFFSQRDQMEALQPASTIVTQRSWQEWLRAAREAANLGDFREAVHSAYWAGIARLEDLGAVPRDRAKTPREYLRIVAETPAAEPGSPPSRKEPLVALTTRLERIWYANHVAGPGDFRESLRQLEELGCPLE